MKEEEVQKLSGNQSLWADDRSAKIRTRLDHASDG
jgi:hypothetical protein